MAGALDPRRNEFFVSGGAKYAAWNTVDSSVAT